METIYVFGSLAAAFVVGMAGWAMLIKKRLDRWEVVAKSLGLEFDEETITGRLDGFHLAVGIEERRVGDSIQKSTVFEVLIGGELPAGLLVQKEGFFGKVSNLLGAEDIQLGLPDLDPKLAIKAQNAYEVREWVQRDDVAKGLLKLSKLKYGTFKIENGRVSFESPDVLSNVDELTKMIRKLVSIASLLSASAAKPAQISADPEPISDESDDVLW